MKKDEKLLFSRVIIKLSGESLGSNVETFDKTHLNMIVGEVRQLHDHGVNLAIVIGGGNIFRGRMGADFGIDGDDADETGMLSTCVNCLFLAHVLKAHKIPAIPMTAFPLPFAEPYTRRDALKHLEARNVLVLGGGTGNTNCTTDYAAALRASELRASVIVKATNVDGVYNRDPRKFPDAQKVGSCITHDYAFSQDLGVMDSEAFALCRRKLIPIIVLNMEKGRILRALQGEEVGTIVKTMPNPLDVPPVLMEAVA